MLRWIFLMWYSLCAIAEACGLTVYMVIPLFTSNFTSNLTCLNHILLVEYSSPPLISLPYLLGNCGHI